MFTIKLTHTYTHTPSLLLLLLLLRCVAALVDPVSSVNELNAAVEAECFVGERAQGSSPNERERECGVHGRERVCCVYLLLFFLKASMYVRACVCVRAKFRFHFHFDGVSRRLFRCLFAIGKQRKRKRERRAEAEANKMAPNNITTHTKKKL